jgi:hypothetical protein
MSWTPEQLRSPAAPIQFGSQPPAPPARDDETMSEADHDRTSGQGKESSFSRLRRKVYRSFLRSLPETRWGDRLVSYIQFFRFHKRSPNRSMSYNDVLYRIKTSDDILDPLRVFVSDKEFMKLYVKAVVGEAYVVPTLGVIKSKDAVDTYEFPQQCAIKATHTSGRVILRKNGEPVDREWIKSWFHTNYYRVGREANYKSLQPKVIVEPILFGSWNLQDYKIFCLHGTPKLIQVDVDRYVGHKRKYFDAKWNEQPFSIKYPRTDRTIPQPSNFAEMLTVAARLSQDFWFVRVDLYSDGDKVYVGEITHCADNADGKFMPASAEKLVSDSLFGTAQRGD